MHGRQKSVIGGGLGGGGGDGNYEHDQTESRENIHLDATCPSRGVNLICLPLFVVRSRRYGTPLQQHCYHGLRKARWDCDTDGRMSATGTRDWLGLGISRLKNKRIRGDGLADISVLYGQFTMGLTLIQRVTQLPQNTCPHPSNTTGWSCGSQLRQRAPRTSPHIDEDTRTHPAGQFLLQSSYPKVSVWFHFFLIQ